MSSSIKNSVIYGVITIFLLCLLFSLGISLLGNAPLSDSKIFTQSFLLISLFLGSFVSASKAQNNQVMTGILTSFAFVLIILPFQSIGFDADLTKDQFVYLAFYLVAGAAGGYASFKYANVKEEQE